MGKPFKEHIAEPYAATKSEFIRTGICMREEKGISCTVRFVHESIQLQGKKTETSDEHIYIYLGQTKSNASTKPSGL